MRQVGSKHSGRLLVGTEEFRVSRQHEHPVADETGRRGGCQETLVLRRRTGRGRVHVIFAPGPGRSVYYVDSAYVATNGAVATEAGWLNLCEPGTVRAFLDEALALGWDPDDPPTMELDGWLLFDAVAARRGDHFYPRRPGWPKPPPAIDITRQVFELLNQRNLDG